MTEDTELAAALPVALGRSTSFLGVHLACKRAFDLVGALALIVFLSPIFLVAALLVRLSSHGPALFRQKRWGRGGTHFLCWKFRTMYLKQEHLVDIAELQKLQAQGILLKPENDPRVTRIGAFLRKTSIDELPQLFNVIMGEMSLVGPRPLMLHMLDPYPELCEERGQMRPGITGLWQISARDHNLSALQMASYDLAYIRGYTFWADMRILARTPATVLFGRGAY